MAVKALLNSTQTKIEKNYQKTMKLHFGRLNNYNNVLRQLNKVKTQS